MPFVLALDEGTTSVRAIVFDTEGQVVSVAQHAFEQIYPRPGWVEHDPLEIWEKQIQSATEALAKASLTARDIVAVGITNQRETTVVWNRRRGEPLGNAIVWQDRRTASHCEKLRSEGYEARFSAKTGLLVDPYFSGTKMAWILENIPNSRQLAESGDLAFGTIDTWLIWKLTGGACHVTDSSNASRTLAYNIHTGRWDDELLDILGIPQSLLPTVRSSSEVYGEVSAVDALRGIPISGIAGDQQAALFGQTCFAPGLTKNTYGTGCFTLKNTGRKPVASRNLLLTTVAWELNGERTFALEGSVFIGGAVVQWLRDGLGIIKHSNEIEPLVKSVPDSGGVVFVPAFTGLGAPMWDPHARGAMFGITRGTTAGHIARAALDAIGFQVADLLDAMHADSDMDVEELRVDGGASANDLLLQFQADLLQIPVARPSVTETTALGAAFLAGLAVGYWKDLPDLSGHWKLDRRFLPARGADEMSEQRERWNEAVRRTVGWQKGSET